MRSRAATTTKSKQRQTVAAGRRHSAGGAGNIARDAASAPAWSPQESVDVRAQCAPAAEPTARPWQRLCRDSSGLERREEGGCCLHTFALYLQAQAEHPTPAADVDISVRGACEVGARCVPLRSDLGPAPIWTHRLASLSFFFLFLFFFLPPFHLHEPSLPQVRQQRSRRMIPPQQLAQHLVRVSRGHE